MLLNILLSKREHALFPHLIRSYTNNLLFFLFMNVLGYAVCTMLFFKDFSYWLHVAFLLGLLAIGIYTWWLVIRNKVILITSKHYAIIHVIVMGLALTIWWWVYSYHVLDTGNLPMIQQYTIILSMISIISVAMVGRFSRIHSSIIVLSALCFCIMSWAKQTEQYKLLSFQIVLLAVSELFFIKLLNSQLSDLFAIKDQKNELVEALRQKNISLEQANLAQSRYLSAASHDLRQPLHALALLASDAQRKNSSPVVSETLQKIEQAIDSLSQSFNAMLNLSRLDAGIVKAEIKAFPINRIFSRLQVEFSEVASEKGLGLNFVNSSEWIMSDEGMLHSILSNFVSNALRYTESGGILIGIRRHKSPNFLKIMVYDTGTGVPPEKAQQIFQEYQRLEYAEQRVKGGVGLGLAISERMARLLGTQLIVQSVHYQGSSFGIIVNRAAPQTAEQSQASSGVTVKDHLLGKKVVIIDDDEIALEHLEELLSSWGFDVTVVLSSDMFRELVEEEGEFDLIISDHHLGDTGETGLDILTAAQEIQPHSLKCILMTGDTSSELASLAEAVNVKVIYKPLRPVRMRAFLNTLLNQDEI